MTDAGAIEKSDECRENFEAWKTDNGKNMLIRGEETDADWTAWQAAWQARTETVGGDEPLIPEAEALRTLSIVLAELERCKSRPAGNAVDVDNAYLERNRVVAALAKCFPSGVGKTAIDGWDPAWHNCVYIDLPTGQASWHFHDRDAYLFSGLFAYTKEWDGHTTEEKYDRLHALATRGMICQPTGDENGDA